MAFRLSFFLALAVLLAVSSTAAAAEQHEHSLSALSLSATTDLFTAVHMKKPKCKKPKKLCKMCKKTKKGVKKCRFKCKKSCEPKVKPTPEPVEGCEYIVEKLPAKVTKTTCKCPEKSFVSEYTAVSSLSKCMRDCVKSSTRLMEACDNRKFFMAFRSVANSCCQATCGGVYTFFDDNCAEK